MAKQITQETFDAAVKENIDDFEMTPEEAIEDAVKQFEAQVQKLPFFQSTIYLNISYLCCHIVSSIALFLL